MREFMRATEGITEPNLTADPLGTEGEMTDGPNDFNPHDQTDQRVFEQASTVESPTEGEDDPFIFDDVGDDLGASLPTFNLSMIENGPQF